MERLLHELVDLEVESVWLESRTQSLNRKDVELVAAVRSKKLIPDSLYVDSAVPSTEPMLWVPDAIAGAVGAHRKGATSAAHMLLSDMIHEIELDLR